MAFTKSEKAEMVAKYGEWLEKSQGVFTIQYEKMNMKAIDRIRAKIREAGGESHVVKNTLITRAYKNADYDVHEEITGTSLVSFAFTDVASVAKAVNEIVKDKSFKIKGGYLGKKAISVSDVKTLGELPPLPEMRAKLLGTISAPASKLVRTLAEPGRSLAGVLQAHVDANSAVAE